MILKKEIIEKAVNWWVEKVTVNQPHSNGDNRPVSFGQLYYQRKHD